VLAKTKIQFLFFLGKLFSFRKQKKMYTSHNTHFAAPLLTVAAPIFGAGVARCAKIVPAPNIAKCGTLAEIPKQNLINIFLFLNYE